MIARRALLGAALATPAPMAPTLAQEGFPNRPVRLVVAYSAGGVADTCCRILQQKVGEHLGQPLIIENRTGASGALGGAFVAQSPPDGYTLLVEGVTSITLPAANRNLPLDYASLVPVTQITQAPYVLGVRKDFPAEDLRGFLAEARRRPGEVTFGTPGIAHIGHLMGELIQHKAGVRLEHIPYRGGADAARDLIGQRIDAAIISESSLQPAFANGARPFGITGPRRRPNLPSTPAIAEVLPGYDLSTWMIIFAPSGTPAPIVERLGAAFRHATSDPTVQARLDQTGNDAVVGSAAEAASLVARDRVTLTQLIRQAGLLASG